jgi:hypothetical protein
MLRKMRPEEELGHPKEETPSSTQTDITGTQKLPHAGWDKLLNILIGGLGLIVVALVISLIIRLNSSSGTSAGSEPSAEVPTNESATSTAAQGTTDEHAQVKSKAVRVEVLNGAGVAKLASKAADFLRGKGFDVVQTGNAPHSNFKKSIVQDRLGDIQKAQQVAAALGIGESGIIQQKNPQLYLDVTVIIGQDYKSLKFLGN